MSELPRDALSYQAVVAEYFLGLRGAGLMLSPLDQETVAEWERRGVPVAVVCRGLRRGLEENAERRGPGASLPRSLRALRFAVEDEWRAYSHDRVGDAAAPPDERAAAAARLESARSLVAEAARAADRPERDGYREAWRALADVDLDRPGGAHGPSGAHATPLQRVEAALACADDRILSAWLGSLPREARAALGPRLRLLAGPRPAGASLRAHRAGLRAHLLDAAREAGLTCLRGSV